MQSVKVNGEFCAREATSAFKGPQASQISYDSFQNVQKRLRRGGFLCVRACAPCMCGFFFFLFFFCQQVMALFVHFCVWMTQATEGQNRLITLSNLCTNIPEFNRIKRFLNLHRASCLIPRLWHPGSYRTHIFQRRIKLFILIRMMWVPQDPYFLKKVAQSHLPWRCNSFVSVSTDHRDTLTKWHQQARQTSRKLSEMLGKPF